MGFIISNTAGENMMNSFISHYDIHAYFEKDTPSEEEAMALQDKLRRTFPNIRLYPPCRDPVGPHPVGMWEGHITTEAEFATVVPWLCFNHGNIDILIHPNAISRGEGILDHTNRALWLGTPKKLDLSIFRR